MVFELSGERVVVSGRREIRALLTALRHARIALGSLIYEGDSVTIGFRRVGGIRRRPVKLYFFDGNPYRCFGPEFWLDLRLVGETRAREVRAELRSIRRRVTSIDVSDLGTLRGASAARAVRGLLRVTADEFDYAGCPVEAVFHLRGGGSRSVVFGLWCYGWVGRHRFRFPFSEVAWIRGDARSGRRRGRRPVLPRGGAGKTSLQGVGDRTWPAAGPGGLCVVARRPLRAAICRSGRARARRGVVIAALLAGACCGVQVHGQAGQRLQDGGAQFRGRMRRPRADRQRACDR
jgi:hypothetical protein